jgi:hypothetical protein
MIDREPAAILRVAAIGGLLLGFSASGCATVTDPPMAPMGRRERALDLIVPESADTNADLANLDDAAIEHALEEGNRQVNELTAQSFQYAAEHGEENLSRDAGYRSLLLKLKTAETKLGLIEDEKARRTAAKKRP